MGKMSKQVWKNIKLTTATKIKAYKLFPVTPSIGQSMRLMVRFLEVGWIKNLSVFPYTCVKSITNSFFQQCLHWIQKYFPDGPYVE